MFQPGACARCLNSPSHWVGFIALCRIQARCASKLNTKPRTWLPSTQLYCLLSSIFATAFAHSDDNLRIVRPRNNTLKMNSTHNNASLTPSREYFESGLREYIRCDVYHDTNELDFIVRWGMLLYDRNAGLVQEIKSLGLDQGGRQDYWKYPLLYGVQIDIGFVRFMVQLMEQQGITKTAILTDFSLRDRGGRGALACAMDSQQEEVVDFLLDEWKKKQVSKRDHGPTIG